MDFETILAGMHPAKGAVAAVAAADDGAVLRAMVRAHEWGIATPIFCGDPMRIRTSAREAQVDIAGFEIMPAASEVDAARAAVALVRQGRATMLMKGLLHTATLLRAVLDRENGLRTGRLLSHVSIVHSPVLEKMLLLTDGAMIPHPDLEKKVEMLNNAVEVARALGIERPKVAILAAVETINPELPATMDAAALTAMYRRGQIRGCVVDGPLAIDLAISKESVRRKGIVSDVAGEADILLFHDIEAANSVGKTFAFAGDSFFGGVVVGATVPIALTSRADTEENKLLSIACAATIGK